MEFWHQTIMPIKNAARILEIDALPPHIPSEVATMLRPVLDEQRRATAVVGVTITSGESFDADFPASHSSYFILLRFPKGNQLSESAVNGAVNKLTEFCNSNRLPIVEIQSDHPEFSQYLLEPSLQ